MFVRVSERKPDGGVVLRGCKAHQPFGPNKLRSGLALLGAKDATSSKGHRY